MKNIGAEPGEKCPFCGNAMNPGATVCGHCRAIREIVREGTLNSFGQFMIVISMLTTVVSLFWIAAALTLKDWLSVIVGFIILIAPLALTWAIRRSGKDVVRYHPPRDLQQEDASRRAEEERRRRLYD